MKANLFPIVFLLFFFQNLTAQIGINSTNTPPATNAMLDISSTTKGLLIPRMTTIQRIALTTSDGLTVYDTDTKSYWFYNGTSWQNMNAAGGGSSKWLNAGNDIYNQNTGNVGIGIVNPQAKLHIEGNVIVANDLSVAGTGAFSQINSGGTSVSGNGINIPVTWGGAGKSMLFDWGYNNIKAGISYKPTQTVYASDMFFHIWDNTSSFIFGRDDPVGYGGQYFAEWMRIKNGKFGIGTNDPIEKLHVVGNTILEGNLKIDNVSKGAGKVLTSDANGQGTWQTLPAVPNSGWTKSGFNVHNTDYSNGFVGIGTTTPGFPLNFANTSGDKISLWGNTGWHYGFGIQSGLLQMHTDGSGANIAFGYGQSSSFTERARIINAGEYGMTLTGRLQLRTGTQSAGTWLLNAANSASSAFIGLVNDSQVGFYGTGPAQWGLVMNTGNGNVGIGNTNPLNKLSFAPALEKKISLYPGGTGDVGMAVSGSQLELYCDPGGRTALGIDSYATGFKRLAYASDQNQKFTVEGYVNADGYVTFSDERYKKDIETIPNSLANLIKLRGTNYHFKTKEFAKNNFSENKQFGLIAQEIEKIYPELVVENNDGYKSINYQGFIPILIESIKDLKKEINELRALIGKKEN